MKKILSIFTIILILALTINFNIVNATDAEPETEPTVNLTYNVEQKDNQVIFTISLGDFEGIEENIVMSAVADLDFYDNQIETIEGKAYDDWKVTVSAETKTVLFETDSAKPNSKLGEIIFNLNTSNITETTQGVVAINELNISDGIVLDEIYPRNEFTYVLQPQTANDNDNTNTVTDDDTTENEPGINDITISDPDKSESGTSSNGTPNTNKDSTKSPDKKLPQTGISIVLIVGIITITVLAIVGFIRYKTIKIK